MKNLFKIGVIVILILAITLTVVACGEEETPHTHQYTEEITEAPSCTEKGEKTFTCACGDSYTEEISANNHADADKNHVCDNECGVAQGTHAEQTNSHTCAYCGQTAGECRDGDNDHDCDVCGAVQGTHAEQTNSHTCAYCGQTAGECRDGDNDHDCDICETELSTCQAAENSHNCATCGTPLSICQAGTPVQENSTAAACGKPGSYDEVTYCTVCGKELKREKITTDALPHSYQENITKPATCKEEGSKTLTCSACGDTKTETIPVSEHSLTTYEAKAPTCTAIGWEEYEVCSKCDYTTYKELAKTSHNYNAVVTKPTCTADGYTTYTCSCGHTYRGNVTEATGHAEKAVVTSPDCENGGYTTFTCTVCGETRTGDPTEKLGHDYEVSVQNATCTENGVKTYTCKNNATHTYTEEITAKGHDYNVSVKDATCTEDGVETGACKNCSDTYTKEIPASGSHSFTNGYKCDNCDYDTTEFRLVNGGFENGLNGWTVVGNIGKVSSETHYWINDPERAEGYAFGMDEANMFSAYAPGAFEGAVGTLTSSTFKVGGSGWITFKVGAMRDGNYVYIDVVDAETKEILVRYYNGLWSERTENVKSGCTLVAYKADLSKFEGREVFFRISDNADSGYGLFFVDSFITYYESEPEGFNVATEVRYEVSGTIYDLFNGSFEINGLAGWWNNGDPGAVTNANAFFNGAEYGKVDDYLYSGVEDHLAGNGREGNTGTLTSSVFEIGGSGWISFMLGGGGNEYCYVQVIDAVTGEVLAKYHQQAFQDAVLKTHIADLSAYIGRTVRIQVVDYASGNWGCVSFDNVVTYYESKPEGIEAKDITDKNSEYKIVNGGFESGNLYGWESIGEIGVVTNANNYWDGNPDHSYRKDGVYLFTGVGSDGVDTLREGNTGTLTSSAFKIGGIGYISFMLGGGGNAECYVQIIDAETGEVLAKYHQQEHQEGVLKTHIADLSAYMGRTVKLQVVDYAINNWGCVSFDNVVTYYASAEELPAGITANNIK